MAIPAGRKEPQARSLASLSKSLIRKGSDRTGLSDRRIPVLAGKLVPKALSSFVEAPKAPGARTNNILILTACESFVGGMVGRLSGFGFGLGDACAACGSSPSAGRV